MKNVRKMSGEGKNKREKWRKKIACIHKGRETGDGWKRVEKEREVEKKIVR